jgi:subtilase-type serine protease
MSKYLSSVSAAALTAVLLAGSTGTANAVDQTVGAGETLTTTQGVDLNSTLTIEEGGAIIVPDDAAIEFNYSNATGTITIDNSGLLQATGEHTIFADGKGKSVAEPLTFIINNRETGVITNDTADPNNRDVIRPSRENFIVQINNWGTIQHQGNLDTEGDGIDFQDKNPVSLTVNNYETGFIEGARHGITGKKPVTVYNEGTIGGRNGSGINIDTGGVIVTNKGLIYGDYKGYDDGDGDGIDVDLDLTLENWGRIEGRDAGGFKDNSSSGEPRIADGVALGGGTITNHAGGEIYGKGYGIRADGQNDGSAFYVTKIYNEGLIEAGDYDAIQLNGDFDDVLENRGTIKAGKYGVAVDMGDGNDQVTLFTGSKIEGLLDGGLGNNTLTLDGSGEDVLSEAVENFNRLNVNAGTWSLEGRHDYATAYIYEGATLIIDDAIAEMRNGQGINLKGGRLDASGAVDQIYSDAGTLAIAGDGIGTLSVKDTLSLESEFVYDTNNQLLGIKDSTLEITVDANGHSDFITVTNPAKDAYMTAYAGTFQSIDYGALLVVQALAGNYAEETQYHIIHVDGYLNGDGFQDAVQTNFAFLDASVFYESDTSLGYETTDFYLTLTRNDTAFWDVAETSNQKSVAQALSAAGDSDLHNEIVTMSVDEAQGAFNQLSGESHASNMSTQVVQANLVTDTIQNRFGFAFTGPGGASSGFEEPQYLGASEKQDAPHGGSAKGYGWIKGYGEWLSLDGDGNAASVDGSVGGVLGGYDVVSKQTMFGLAVGYSQATTDVDSRLASADTDTFLVAAYAAAMLDRNVKVSGGGSYGWSSTDSERVALQDKLTASYDGNTGIAFGEIAYLARMGATVLEPFAGVTYIDVDQDGFTETGGIGALTSDGQSFSSTASTVGVRLAYDTTSGDGMRVTPRASLAWRHAYGDVTPDAVMSFADTGTSFTVDGAPIAEDSLIVGAGIEMGLSEGVTLGLDYTGAFAEEAVSNAGKAVGRVAF